MTANSPIDAAMRRLVAMGCERLDVPILHPAEPFLDLAGEELRARVFLTDDGAGHLMCLRPEFTIPAGRAWLAGGGSAPRRYACAGTVFRQRDEGPAEFPQGGIEAIGEADRAAADAGAIANALGFVREWAPARPVSVVVGDQGLFEAVTGALGLPGAWARRLVRLFGDAPRLAAALEGLTGERAPAAEAPETRLGAAHELPEVLTSALRNGAREAVVAIVDAHIAESRMGQGARNAGEIADRLIERRRLADTRLDAQAAKALDALLALECPLDRVADEVRALAPSDPGIDAALDAHARRLDALDARNVEPAALTFRGAFGRSLDYYTGLVFEIRDGRTVLAGGGRYDGLLSLLGASEAVPAVGFALWLDRLGPAAEDAAGAAATGEGTR